MDCIVHGVTKSQTQLRDLHFLHKRPPVVVEQVSVSVWGTLEGDEGPLLFHVIIKVAQTVSNGNPVQYSCQDPLLWDHRRRSLVGCSPWGREESDTTE